MCLLLHHLQEGGGEVECVFCGVSGDGVVGWVWAVPTGFI